MLVQEEYTSQVTGEVSILGEIAQPYELLMHLKRNGHDMSQTVFKHRYEHLQTICIPAEAADRK